MPLALPDVESIVSKYDIGALEQVEALTAGTVQTNLLLRTTRGKYVLRYYARNRLFEAVLFEVNLIRYLTQRAYPCPAVLKDRHGKLAAVYRDKPYALFEFIEGTHVERPNERQKEQLIQKAAELQNLTRNYRPSYAQYRWNYGAGLCERLAQEAADRIGTANAREKLVW